VKPYGRYGLFSYGFKKGAMTDYVTSGCLSHGHIFILCAGAPSNKISGGGGEEWYCSCYVVVKYLIICWE
jgi:hypothetical protein